MQKVFTYTISILLAIFVFGASAQATSAASLDFDPTSVTGNVDGTFTIKITIDTSSEKSPSATVIVKYDSEVIEPSSVANGTFFADSTNTIGSDKVSFFGFNNDPDVAKSGKGTVATITFKGVKEGTTTLEFVCDASNTADTSTIEKNDIDATNIISCGQNGTASVTIGTGADGTDEDTDTDGDGTPDSVDTDTDGDGIPNSTDTDVDGDGVIDSTPSGGLGGPESTISALPRSGTFDNIVKFALPGALLVGIGVALKLFLL